MKPVRLPFVHLRPYRVNQRRARCRTIHERLLGWPAGTDRRPKHWWSRTWQAEWDDTQDLGAFRAFTRTGALRRAIKARLRLGEAVTA